MKSIYQIQPEKQRLNISKNQYPILIDTLDGLNIPKRIASIMKSYNKDSTVEKIATKSVNSFFGTPDGRIEIEHDKWEDIVEEFKTQTKINEVTRIVIYVRGYDYKLLLVKKRLENE